MRSPLSRKNAVVSGTSTRLSSFPNAVAPLLSSTPMTVKRMPEMAMSTPTGSRSPNRSSAVCEPSTATFFRFCTCAGEMNSPDATSKFRTLANSGVTPATCANVSVDR